MKKLILSCVLLFSFGATIQAQCPSFIDDDQGDGSTYAMTLANVGQFANFAINSTKSINGQTYVVYRCEENFGVTLASLGWDGLSGMPVVLATSAPVSFTVNSNNCSYNSSGNLTVLPVELLAFTASPQYNTVKLAWQTASETHNQGFDVQRSDNGSNFQTIGTVKAVGKAAGYNFTDANPLNGTTYYRLKINDTDGKFTYSNVLSLAANGKTKVKVYPSVTSGILSIESAESIESVSVFNSIGQLVYTSAPITSNQYTINHLPSGVYVVRVAAGGAVVSEKVFKQ